MNYAQILNLLDRGLTPDQIIGLQAAPDPVPAVAPDPVPAAASDPSQASPPASADPAAAPAWAAELTQTISRMTNALHASAIMNSQQPEVPPETAEEALAAVIAPPPKKGR